MEFKDILRKLRTDKKKKGTRQRTLEQKRGKHKNTKGVIKMEKRNA